MNNKTKKEIWEELQMYKKQVQQYEDSWEVRIIDEYEKQVKFVNKALRITALILLVLSAFLIGMMM
jgi:hypothetical protein